MKANALLQGEPDPGGNVDEAQRRFIAAVDSQIECVGAVRR